MRPLIVVLIALAAAGTGFLGGRYSVSETPALPPAVPIDPVVKVIRVGDGDTIEVIPLDNPDRKEKVRLLGLNAPGKGEKLFSESQKALASLVLDKTVTIEYEIEDTPARDDHNRVLAYVLIDGANINVEVVRQGWSPFSTRHGGARYAEAFNKAEAQARESKSGIWAGK